MLFRSEKVHGASCVCPPFKFRLNGFNLNKVRNYFYFTLKASVVLLKPAAPGTGIIAGGTVRTILALAGIKNIRAKCLRSTNPTNVVKATFEGLRALKTAEEIAALRGLSTEDVKA